jgi:hypothetical protein
MPRESRLLQNQAHEFRITFEDNDDVMINDAWKGDDGPI